VCRSARSASDRPPRAFIAWVACFYNPPSFVTGIFGINFEEIRGTQVSTCVCFATLCLVLAATFTGFALHRSSSDDVGIGEDSLRGTLSWASCTT